MRNGVISLGYTNARTPFRGRIGVPDAAVRVVTTAPAIITRRQKHARPSLFVRSSVRAGNAKQIQTFGHGPKSDTDQSYLSTRARRCYDCTIRAIQRCQSRRRSSWSTRQSKPTVEDTNRYCYAQTKNRLIIFVISNRDVNDIGRSAALQSRASVLIVAVVYQFYENFFFLIYVLFNITH